MFLSDEGPLLKTLDFTIRIGSIHQPLYISICYEVYISVPPYLAMIVGQKRSEWEDLNANRVWLKQVWDRS